MGHHFCKIGFPRRVMRNFVFANGVVRFLSLVTYQALATRDGGEVFRLPF